MIDVPGILQIYETILLFRVNQHIYDRSQYLQVLSTTSLSIQAIVEDQVPALPHPSSSLGKR